jgi:hypothetical protein
LVFLSFQLSIGVGIGIVPIRPIFARLLVNRIPALSQCLALSFFLVDFFDTDPDWIPPPA